MGADAEPGEELQSRPPPARSVSPFEVELSDAERADYAEFTRRVLDSTGIDLSQYRLHQMHRRLRNLVDRAGLKEFAEYFRLLERDPAERAVFLDRLTVNVSELFRNPEHWEQLEKELLPALLKRKPRLRIWSAGCSYGAEPYSLAMLLEELTPGVAHTIHATDLNAAMLDRGREGRFSEEDVRNMSEDRRRRFLNRLDACDPPAREAGPALAGTGLWPQAAAGEGFQVVPEMRSRIQFRRQNLLADPFERWYDLICCRNVVIYFSDEAKNRLYRRFYESLAPGGILFLGATERVGGYRDVGLEAVKPLFYQKAMGLNGICAAA
jgi:chemotaxis protein methyltransferase CheR